ncbi:hypothetical protein [Tropicimonas isoalkanivorans]|uniref:Uncharacterized protein n=1 Tax=Tropicimonas isoalkanivorans TaxID=441112 RepID=A0A1I1FMT0_9RHOB|nr:hypothetical protein [Tropicimonas isoalkanivorans]SFC00625.1 hypothetical protein SAMN04488094_102215 [Tropicimonas isoalkanivorans]
MNAFREVDDADPALAFSPMVRAIEKTFVWIDENGGIPLTPSKAFKRVFVHWAAAEFEWPGHTEAELFAVNKVLNEPDFAPLTVLHDLMIAMKLGRHYKGEFRLTKAGEALVSHPGRIFGNWDVFLNVLNVETEDGATGARLRRVLFGEPEKEPLPRYDGVMGQLYIQVLRPLCWAGLLQQGRGTASYRFEETVFMKTPLWRAAIRLETDQRVRRAQRH